MPDEHRLDELREQARNKGVVAGRGVDIAGGPIPRKLATASPSGGRPGYYGEPVVRPPVWTWEIPVYFFVGGLAGMAAVIALIGLIFVDRGDRRDPLSNPTHHGSRTPPAFSQYAARFQASIADVCRRMDSICFWRLRRSLVNRPRTSCAPNLHWRF